jgi:hypothetical protein
MPIIDKRKEAEVTLPTELRQMFNALVEDYETACQAHIKGGYVFRNYNILADLIRAGWRKNRC